MTKNHQKFAKSWGFNFYSCAKLFCKPLLGNGGVLGLACNSYAQMLNPHQNWVYLKKSHHS